MSALAAVLVVAVLTTSAAMPAVAETKSHPERSASSGPVRTDPAAVPWASVGPGWLLASWEPHPQRRPVAVYLLLVSPSGARYPLYKLPGREPTLIGWSGDGHRVLVDVPDPAPLSQNVPQPDRYMVIDLKSGRLEDSFKPGPSEGGSADGTASFTTPHGLALLDVNLGSAAGVQWLERYTLSGVPRLRYPNAFPRVGMWRGEWLESPNGTQIVMGADKGLAIVNNDGTLAATLPIRHVDYCDPSSFWGAGIILANCGLNNGSSTLFEFSQTWSKPRELTAPSPEADYFDAWRVDGRVFVQAFPLSCGYPELGELHGNRVVLLAHPSESGIVVGTTSTSLALASGECQSGSSGIGWYRPSTNTYAQVLGPPFLGGDLTGVVGYPTPFAVGGGGPGGGP